MSRPRKVVEMNPLATIRRDNVRRMMEYHDVKLEEITRGTRLSNATVRQAFGGNIDQVKPASQLTMDTVSNFFKVWHGALDIRDFDPSNFPAPRTSLQLTINVQNANGAEVKKIKKLFRQLGGLYDGG